MASEHLVCEFCAAEFGAFEEYQAYKASRHAAAARNRQLDEEVQETHPASDTPSPTNPTAGMGRPAHGQPRSDEDTTLQPSAPESAPPGAG